MTSCGWAGSTSDSFVVHGLSLRTDERGRDAAQSWVFMLPCSTIIRDYIDMVHQPAECQLHDRPITCVHIPIISAA